MKHDTSLNQHDPKATDNVRTAADLGGYVVRAVGRNWLLFKRSLIAIAALAAVVCAVIPRVYEVKMRVLTQPSPLKPALLVNPDRAVPIPTDNPSVIGATELIKSRNNLKNVLQDSRLVERLEAERSWFGKSVSWVMNRVLPQSKHNPEDDLVKLIDDHVMADVDGDVVTVNVQWAQPTIALALSEATLSRFLKLRFDAEMDEFSHTVAILTENERKIDSDMTATVGRMQKVFAAKDKELRSQQAHLTGLRTQATRPRVIKIDIPRPAPTPKLDPEREALRQALLTKEGEVTEVKRGYEAQVKAAEENYANLRSTLGPKHPDVVDARRQLDSLARPPAHVEQAREAQLQLLNQLGELDTHAIVASTKGPTPAREAANDSDADSFRLHLSEALYKQMESDPEIKSLLTELKRLEDVHDKVAIHLERAKLETDVARAGFEARYIITLPPVMPRQSIKPNWGVVLAAGIMATFLLSTLLCIAVDAFSGRINESWQAARFLDLPLLGEVEADPEF